MSLSKNYAGLTIDSIDLRWLFDKAQFRKLHVRGDGGCWWRAILVLICETARLGGAT